ncbi:uncharacterized protein B0H18DRAFT_527622 [Fomitopsis serialis]|uniref:uncharacterized protein n=1 Tax=Fomitopsis serialis TaxID=139415 RepID=UPI00200881CF|nr:uncharacterized protein B0H18DRAFT_527622 [Neoantrodia serialis]KAH9922115.1 hypothetical protein B0H18DRAFT_527622 [Neoantrodia serialis]
MAWRACAQHLPRHAAGRRPKCRIHCARLSLSKNSYPPLQFISNPPPLAHQDPPVVSTPVRIQGYDIGQYRTLM